MSARMLLALALLLLTPLTGAIDQAPAFAEPHLQARYEHITRELRCLQCRGETIADSNVELARDLRRQVREMIAAGKSDEEIFEYMTARYGDFVLFRPPVNPRTWLLWAAPALFLVAGAMTALIVIRRKARLPEEDPADPGLGAS